MLEILVALLSFIILFMLLVGAAAAFIWWSRRSSPGKASTLTKRISLSDGQWAKARTRLTQSMWDAMVAGRPTNVEQDENGRLIDHAGNDVTILVSDQVARVLILAGVTEWSYGPVDDDVLVATVPLEDQETLSGHFETVLNASPLWRRATGGN